MHFGLRSRAAARGLFQPAAAATVTAPKPGAESGKPEDEAGKGAKGAKPGATEEETAELDENGNPVVKPENAKGSDKPEDKTGAAAQPAPPAASGLTGNARVKAILEHPAAAAQRDAAMYLALDTDIDAATATTILGKVTATAPAAAAAATPAERSTFLTAMEKVAKPQRAFKRAAGETYGGGQLSPMQRQQLRIAATLFSQGWKAFTTELAGAMGVLWSFARSVATVMTRIGERLGLVREGGSAGVGAAIVGFTFYMLQASGVLAILQVALLVGAAGMALLTYATIIATIGMKFFIESFFFASRAIALFYGASAIALTAVRTAFMATFAAIRVATVAFWAFMALSPFSMVIGIGLIVTAIAVAAVLILRHFGVIGDAWTVMTNVMTGAWNLALNAMMATGGFFQDWYNGGFIGGFLDVTGTLFTQLWLDFVNLGIWAWNKLKGLIGLKGKTEYYGSAADLSAEYRKEAQARGLMDAEGNAVPRTKAEPGMPDRPRKKAVVNDYLPSTQPDEIVTGSDGEQRSLRDELARREREADAKFVEEAKAYKAAKDAVIAKREAERAKAEADANKPGAEGPGFLDQMKAKLGALSPMDFLKGLWGDSAPAPGDAPPKPSAFDIGNIAVWGQGAKAGPGTGSMTGAFPNAGGLTVLPNVGQGTDQDAMPPEMRALRDRLMDSLTGNRSDNPDPYGVGKKKEAEEGGGPELRAGLDGILGRIAALGTGTGLQAKTPFAQGPVDTSDLQGDIQATGARGTPLDPLGKRQGQTVVAATVEIAPGDKKIYANADVIDDLVKRLTDLGLSARTEQARVT